MNIENKGTGKYTVSFDYYNATGNFNAYCALGKLASGDETADTWTEINEYGHTDPNLVSAPAGRDSTPARPSRAKMAGIVIPILTT